MKTGYNNDVKQIELDNAKCIVIDVNEDETDLKLNANYGDKDSIIIDMHGIDNFRFAKSLEFRDDTVRKIALKLNVLDKNSKYLRFGCSGAKESKLHPGGEVFEEMVLNGKNASGISQSVSGYLPKESNYSKSISLYDDDKIHLREERIVYSHTAFLRECGVENSNSIYINIEPKEDNTSLLDLITEIASKLNLKSYAIQIYMSSKGVEKHSTKINGRVLKHMPERPFKVLQEATDIGLEQLFELKDTSEFYGVGTHYLRYEPEWKEFTKGHQYERRGHIHCTIVGNKTKDVHEVFHLRDVYVSKDTKLQLVLTPVDNIYRIYPVYKKESEYYTKSCDKNVDEIMEKKL